MDVTNQLLLYHGAMPTPDVNWRGLAIAVPTYMERDNIRDLIRELVCVLPGVQILVVDDSSPDGTAEIVNELGRNNPSIHLISRPRKEGLASAYFDVFQQIVLDEKIEFVVTMDADHSHDPKELPRLLEQARQHDLVVGSRYINGGQTRNWSWSRFGLSRLGNIYARLVTGVPIRDLTTGFVVYRRQLLQALLHEGVRSKAFGFQIEMKFLAHRLRARIAEVPITFVDRTRGHSKLEKLSIWEGISVPLNLRLFAHTPLGE
jgi:dolichol-phosphate mannosyltransferase